MLNDKLVKKCNTKMPKALSLKKSQKPASSKNQKPITHFFKNNNAASTHPQHQSPTKTQSLPINETEKKSIKRKANSPVVLNSIEIDDDDDFKDTENLNLVRKKTSQTPKKSKIENSIIEKSHKNSYSRTKTPEKENNLNVVLVTKDSGIVVDITSSQSIEKSQDIKDLDTINRWPLTPVKVCSNGENVYKTSNSCEKMNHVSSSTKIENHVQNNVTPKKVLNFDSQNLVNGLKKLTPKKSPCIAQSPRISQLKTPDKEELSPSRSGSTVKIVEFSPKLLDDGFEDQWDVDTLDEVCAEDLDLSVMQRCELLTVTQHPGRLELRLQNSDNKRATCYLEGVWFHTPLSPGDTISVIASRNPAGEFCVGNSGGLLCLRPDQLVSSTSVVGGVFCQRKAVLQERYRGLDAGNTAMTIGILIHELVQLALTENIMDIAKLSAETDGIIKESLQMLYDAGIEENEARTNMQQYLPPLAEFMQTYVAKSPLSKQPQKDQWNGHIDKVLDIEENLCCPQLGLKGKIDATVQVTTHDRKGRQRAIVPLELKSGKASVSAEHRGQLVLYGMMLSALRGKDPCSEPSNGLLLYLKERVDVREVSCGHPERRDLMLLRNQLAGYLAPTAHGIDPEQIPDIEEAACSLQQRLPEPINHHNACAKCPYLTLCELHLWHTESPSVSESHPLWKLRDTALGHLSPAHIDYFLQWAALLRIEERGQLTTNPLHALWNDKPEKRSKRGTCAANLKLKSVQKVEDRYLHVFERQVKAIESLNSSGKSNSGPQEGEFSIVSIDGRPWIAAGVVSTVKEKEITILLERDLSRRLSAETVFYIDTYESYATVVQNQTNLGVLLEDSDRSLRLRRLIIDREPPEFAKKLPREVGRLGSKLMRALNIEQQRAILKAVSALDYALLQGLPGTGKTQTISVLIQMLVGLKQRVLVTAHTHSAVDNVLSRLPPHLKVLRLGSVARVAANLLERCEQKLVEKCDSVKQLEELYASMFIVGHLVEKCDSVKQLEKLYASVEVVGVTCLGASHTMLSRTQFDVCIVDEATQVLQSTVLRPLFAASKFVLVGDPEQLPPVVRSKAARRLGMEESLFHRLMRDEATCTLQLQYRMNQPLADLANKVAYRDRLKCADQKVATARLAVDLKNLTDHPTWIQKVCSPEPQDAALFLDMSPIETTKVNIKACTNVEEACVVMAIVEAMLQGGLKPSDIGIIAPYRDQVSLLRRVLYPRGVGCSTVDQFQGRDKPVILYSCTKKEGDDTKAVKEGEILNDQRRLAVSVTRAKHKLVTVGNSSALQRYMPLQRLIEASTKLALDSQVVNSVVSKYRTNFV